MVCGPLVSAAKLRSTSAARACRSAILPLTRCSGTRMTSATPATVPARASRGNRMRWPRPAGDGPTLAGDSGARGARISRNGGMGRGRPSRSPRRRWSLERSCAMVSRVPVTSFTEARRVNSVRWISCIAVAAACVVSAAAWSQGRLDADSLRAFGGTYSPNCSNPQAPRAHVTAAALMVEQGNQRMTGGNVEAAASFLGPSPPPNYRTVLLGEVRGQQLQFILFQDAAGYYLTLDGDQRVRAALGKTLLGHRYRQCGVSARAPATSPPPAAAAPRSAPAASGAPAGAIPPLDTMTAPGLLMDPKFKAAWHRALGPKAREP